MRRLNHLQSPGGVGLIAVLILLGSLISVAASLEEQRKVSSSLLKEHSAALNAEGVLEEAIDSIDMRGSWENGGTCGGVKDQLARLDVAAARLPGDAFLAGRIERIRQGLKAASSGGAPTGTAIREVSHAVHEIRQSLSDRSRRRVAELFEASRRASRWQVWSLPVVAILSGLILGGVAVWRFLGEMRSLGARIDQVARKLRPASGHLPAEGDLLGVLQGQLCDLALGVDQVLQRLRSREKEIEHAERLANLGRLWAPMIHELKNSLFAVKALVQVNREEAQRRAFAADDFLIIESELRVMERQLRSLIGLGRIAGEGNVRADLNSVVRDAVGLTRGCARVRQITLQTDLPDEPALVCGDPVQVQQVAVNLILNAIEATPRDGVVEITLRTEGRAEFELSVRDSGPGIDPKILSTIFQPFVTTKSSSLGLGLAVSRRIANALGGHLLATNLERRGAQFTLVLPSLPEEKQTASAKRSLQATGV